VVVAAPEEPEVPWPKGVRVLRLPIWKPVLSRSQWAIWRDVTDAGEPVLTHCVMGAERTGILCAHAQVHRGVRVPGAMRDLHKYGLGYWSGRRHRTDLEDLKTSLLSLQVTGNVLSDAAVGMILIHNRVSVLGTVDETLASLLRVKP
jgi:hypothetical protein